MAAAAPNAATALPSRTTGASGFSQDDDGSHGDPSATIELLEERLRAWKHATGYLEDYISEVAKAEKARAKEQDKILKTLSGTLKEVHQFETAIGGVSGLFENIRANTQALSNMHAETCKNLTGSVLPILERLHQELKAKSKEVTSGAGKGAKAVEVARIATQKHIDALSQNTAHFDSSGGKVAAANDPYVLQRGTFHRLNKQILEENNSRQDMINVQNNFAEFEAHVIAVLQNTISSYNELMSGQAEREKMAYGDIATTASAIPADFEWKGFVKRNSETLINPNAPPRSLDRVKFPNENHRATRALIEGSLERKSRGLGGYKTAYYAVTPAGFLHQFKDNDNLASDPVPDVSLYLPECAVGAVDGTKFTVKGKDSSGSRIGIKMAVSAEWQFKAHNAAEATKWRDVIAAQAHATSSLPTSPVENMNVAPLDTAMQAPAQAQEPVASPGAEAAAAAAATAATPVTTTTPTAAPAVAASGGEKIGEKSGEKSGAAAAATATAAASPPTSPQVEKQHYHLAPAENELAEREFVGKQ